MNRIGTFVIGLLLGGAVVGGAFLVADNDGDPDESSNPRPSASPASTPSPTPAAPSPEASSTPAASPAPIAAGPLDDSAVLRLDGIGQLQIGMTVEEMEAATGMKLRIFTDFGPSCRYSQFDDGPRGMQLMLSHRRLVRVDVWGDFPAGGDFVESPIRTVSGIGVGDPIEEAERVYTDHLEREPHPYLGDRGAYLVYDSDPDDGLLLILEADRKKITSFRSGYDQQVRYIEGCA